MRRSAAPSQNGCAKRQKFVSPAYTPPVLPTRPWVVGSNKDFSKPKTHAADANSDNVQTGVEYLQNAENENQKAMLQVMSANSGTSVSDQNKRKKADMIALLSKKSWKSPLQSQNELLQNEAPPPPLSSGTSSNVCDNSRPTPACASESSTSTSCPPVTTSSADTRYFCVMWCKASKKKHKKWEGDAILSTSGRSATLYDTEGKIIGRGTGYKVAELQNLTEDETLFVGGKEIQVMSVLTENDFQSGKCFSSTSDSGEKSLTSPAALSPKVTGAFKPFVNPLQKGVTGLQRHTVTQEKGNILPKYNPTAENALVMPRPTPEQQWQNNSRDGQPVVDVVVDPYLSSFLRQHQREGVVFLYMCIMGLREHGGFGAILADDMGLGKTLQCITLIWTLLKQGPYGGKPVVKKVLVITPGSLVKNWYLEFKKWLGTERLNIYAVSADKRAEDFAKSSMYPVMILSYEMFVRCFDHIKQVPFDLVICDEGHRLKNTAIKTTSLIMTLPCRRRIVLTGTPVQNDLQEFFSIVEFCNPGILGSSSAFRRVYEEPIVASRQPRASPAEKELGKERARELTRLTQMFVLRRTQEVNNDYLPPKVELVLFCRASPLQNVLYQHLLRSKAVRLCLQSRGCQQQLSGSAHLTIIGALKQLCNHPRLIYNKAVQAQQTMLAGSEVKQSDRHSWNIREENGAEDSIYSGLLSLFPQMYNTSLTDVHESGKLEVLSGILSSIWKYSSTDKVVLVSNHTKTLDLLQDFCDRRGYTFLRLDGQTPTGQRQELVNKFNKLSLHRIFLLSSKAGGVGLNLIGASRLILYDIDWNPANDLQAMARVWRDGQRKRVHIYRLLTTGSIEEKVYQRQISKQGLSGTIMDHTSSSSSSVQFSLEDLKDLFSLNESTECETHTMLACPCDGDPDYTPDQDNGATGVIADRRSCQLGGSGGNGLGAKSQLTNLTMAQLLSWRHIKGEFAKQEHNWYLEEVGETLSYVFWNETNCG